MRYDPSTISAFVKAREKNHWGEAAGTHPLVTVSRQRGSGGGLVARRLAEILTGAGRGHQPWIVVDQNIADCVLQDHHLPARSGRVLSEEATSSIDERVQGILGIHVPYDTVLQKMTQTIVRLARMGYVIFVGRGAHVIAAKFPRALHVRFIGSLERRAERVREELGGSLDEAEFEVRKVDERRRNFVRANFHVDIDDPTQYDLVINTDRVAIDEAARMIAALVDSPQFREQESRHLAELRREVLGR